MHETQNVKNAAQSKNRSNESTKGKGSTKTYSGKGQRNKNKGNCKATSASVGNPKSNDIGWWDKSPLYSDVTRIPFNRINGATLAVSEICPSMGLEVVPAGHNHVSIPGIMRFDFVPTLGYADSVNSPLNRCMTSLYAANYARTTGAMQFTQADMALITLASDSIVTNIGLVKRVLGLSFLFNGQNLNMPKALITACGIDPDTVIGRQDEIRRMLNTHIQSLNTLRLPGYMDIFKRHYQLVTNVYADEDDIRAQMYTFVPSGYYMYNDAGTNTLISETSFLQYIPFTFSDANLGIMHVDTLLDIIGQQLSSIRHSSSFALVSGSMQRAFPDADLLQIGIVGLDEVCVPIPDRNMMWQINNMTLLGYVDTDSLHVLQDVEEDILISQPRVSNISINTAYAAYAANRKCHLLNSFDGDTSPEFLMEATRLMCMGDLDVVDEDHYNLIYNSFGTELAIRGYVYKFRHNTGEANSLSATIFTSLMHVPSVNSPSVTVSDFLAEITRFKNHPRIEMGDDTHVAMPIGDLYRWTTIDKSSLDGLNQAALQSVYLTNVIPAGLQ